VTFKSLCIASLANISGRVFQTLGATILKARSPNLSLDCLYCKSCKNFHSNRVRVIAGRLAMCQTAWQYQLCRQYHDEHWMKSVNNR